MIFINIFLLVFSFITNCETTGQNKNTGNLYKFINLFIYISGDHGQTDPSSNVLFGMIKAGPNTDPINHSGYNYNAEKQIGFSQNRARGTGCIGVGGNLRLFSFEDTRETFAKIDKSSEVAKAGYYKINLLNNVSAVVAAGRTSAIYWFTFPEKHESGVQVDFCSPFSEFEEEGHDMLEGK